MKDCQDFFPHGLAGVIFDCDGVMIDSEAANRHFYNLILAALSLPPMTDEQEKYAFMSTTMEALQRMTPPEVHDSLEDLIRKNVDYAREILPRTKLMPGFQEFIQWLHARKVRLAIDTNRTEDGIQRILDFFSLPQYFNPVVTVSGMPPKPAPAGVQFICSQWRQDPERVLYIGDSETDKEAAGGGGVVFAGFGPSAPHGDINVPDYGALTRWLEPLFKN